MTPTRIFISYSHGSDTHRLFVQQLAQRLRGDGLDCQIDQYVNGFPAEGWQRWMEAQIEQADFVLMVCTPTYLKRYRGLDDAGGRGVTFEGVVISQVLYDAYYRNTKFVPLLPEVGDIDDVPSALKGFGVFRMGLDYEGLYRYLTGQAAVVAPELGEVVVKHPHPNPSPLEGEGLSSAASTFPFTEQVDGQKEKQGMSDTMKAAWIAAIAVLLGAMITVLAMLFGSNGTPSSVQQSISKSQGTQTQVGGDLIIGEPSSEGGKP